MPLEFQRMIAAWEVVVRWHRVCEPGDRTDAALRAALHRAVPDLGLAGDATWAPAVDSLMALGEVEQVQGLGTTGKTWGVSHPQDWAGIVELLYGVRCNLMKAGKSPESRRDRDVCDRAAAVASIVAQHLIDLA